MALKTREEILVEAYNECLRELFLNSNPPIDIEELFKNGFKDDENDKLIYKHSIDEEDFDFILDDVMYAYGIKDDFHDNIEIIKNDLEKGAPMRGETKYDIKFLPPLKDKIGEEHYNIVMEYLNQIKSFYRVDSEVSSFRSAITWGGPSIILKK